MKHRKTRPTWKYVPNCCRAHGQDKCSYDAAQVKPSDPRAIRYSDRKRMTPLEAWA